MNYFFEEIISSVADIRKSRKFANNYCSLSKNKIAKNFAVFSNFVFMPFGVGSTSLILNN